MSYPLMYFCLGLLVSGVLSLIVAVSRSRFSIASLRSIGVGLIGGSIVAVVSVLTEYFAESISPIEMLALVLLLMVMALVGMLFVRDRE